MGNPIVHFEFAGPDDGSLASFYSSLFGWKVDRMGPGYSLVETPDGSPNGAILEAPQSAVVLGVSVPDVASFLERAQSLGASIVMPATDNGYVVKGQLADPAGNVVTLVQADS